MIAKELYSRLKDLFECNKIGSNTVVRIGPVQRKDFAHETHDIDDVVVMKDSLGNEYIEISEIPF